MGLKTPWVVYLCLIFTACSIFLLYLYDVMRGFEKKYYPMNRTPGSITGLALRVVIIVSKEPPDLQVATKRLVWPLFKQWSEKWTILSALQNTIWITKHSITGQIFMIWIPDKSMIQIPIVPEWQQKVCSMSPGSSCPHQCLACSAHWPWPQASTSPGLQQLPQLWPEKSTRRVKTQFCGPLRLSVKLIKGVGGN